MDGGSPLPRHIQGLLLKREEAVPGDKAHARPPALGGAERPSGPMLWYSHVSSYGAGIWLGHYLAGSFPWLPTACGDKVQTLWPVCKALWPGSQLSLPAPPLGFALFDLRLFHPAISGSHAVNQQGLDLLGNLSLPPVPV